LFELAKKIFLSHSGCVGKPGEEELTYELTNHLVLLAAEVIHPSPMTTSP